MVSENSHHRRAPSERYINEFKESAQHGDLQHTLKGSDETQSRTAGGGIAMQTHNSMGLRVLS